MALIQMLIKRHFKFSSIFKALVLFVLVSCSQVTTQPEVNQFCPENLSVLEVTCYSIGEETDIEDYFDKGNFRFTVTQSELTRDSLKALRMSEDYVIHPNLASYTCEFYMASRDTILLAREKKKFSKLLREKLRKFADLSSNCPSLDHDSAGIFLFVFEERIWNTAQAYTSSSVTTQEED